MNEFNNYNLPGIEFYARDIKEVKVYILKKHTSALGNKTEEEAYTIRRGTPILDKINCANPTCTSYFSIRSCIIDAVQERTVKEYNLNVKVRKIRAGRKIREIVVTLRLNSLFLRCFPKASNTLLCGFHYHKFQIFKTFLHFIEHRLNLRTRTFIADVFYI